MFGNIVYTKLVGELSVIRDITSLWDVSKTSIGRETFVRMLHNQLDKDG